jgi:hypothetical protein
MTFSYRHRTVAEMDIDRWARRPRTDKRVRLADMPVESAPQTVLKGWWPKPCKAGKVKA